MGILSDLVLDRARALREKQDKLNDTLAEPYKIAIRTPGVSEEAVNNSIEQLQKIYGTKGKTSKESKNLFQTFGQIVHQIHGHGQQQAGQGGAGGSQQQRQMGSVGPPPADVTIHGSGDKATGITPPPAFSPMGEVGKAQEAGYETQQRFMSKLKIEEEQAKAEAEAKNKYAKGENFLTSDGKVFFGEDTPNGVVNKTTGEIVPNATKAGSTPAAKPAKPPAPPLGEERVAQLNQATEARWKAGNPGKPMPPAFTLHPDATQKDYDNLSKLINESAIASVRAKQEASVGDLSPEAIDALAGVFVRTGQMPAMGLGGMPVRTKVFNRAGQILAGKGPTDPGLGDKLAASSAAFKSLSGALTQLQKQRSAVGAFEGTALKNLQLFKDAAKKVVDTESPWINQPLRSVEQGALGSDEVAVLNTARTVALTEISRVISNPNMTGVLSDEARNQVGALIGEGATLSNVLAASNILEQDMENRKGSLDEEIKSVSGQIGQGLPKKGGLTPPPEFGNGELKAKPPAVGTIEGGHKFKGGDPSKQENWEKLKPASFDETAEGDKSKPKFRAFIGEIEPKKPAPKQPAKKPDTYIRDKWERSLKTA